MSSGLFQRRRPHSSLSRNDTHDTSIDPLPSSSIDFLPSTSPITTTPTTSSSSSSSSPPTPTSTHTPTPSSTNYKHTTSSSSSPHSVSPFLPFYSRSSTGSTHIVAFDPNEVPLDSNPEDPSHPIPFTLMEEVLLLGLKSKEGHLSFWNDSLSYVLRGCILIELFLRKRIALVSKPEYKHLPLASRPVTVINSKITSEVLLDETLRLMKQTEFGTTDSMFQEGSLKSSFGISLHSSHHSIHNTSSSSNSSSTRNSKQQQWSVHTWMDVLSGESWNPLRASYQLRQVRERLAKGLVDKGVLRNEKKNFLLFDIPTHPLIDPDLKDQLMERILHTLFLPTSSSGWHQISLRTIALICAAYAGNVLENVFQEKLSLAQREVGWQHMEALLQAFSQWDETYQRAPRVYGIEHQEGVAAVFSVFSKMDNLI